MKTCKNCGVEVEEYNGIRYHANLIDIGAGIKFKAITVWNPDRTCYNPEPKEN